MADVLVLCYHAVSEDWTADLSVRPDQLREQLELLVRRGYRGATFHEAVSAPEGRTLAVTFDDAYRSVAELAAPILAELGLPGTMFVPTDFPGTAEAMSWPGIDRWADGPHAAELAPLSWRELGALAAAGWEIGSHSCSHPRLTSLDDEALATELEGSRAACEAALGRPCVTLAYPYGDVDARVAEAARTAGYSAAAALPARMYRPHAMAWPRVGVYQPDDLRRFKLKVSPALRAIRSRAGAGDPTA